MLEVNYRDYVLHRKDNLLNRGYDWRGNILKRSISPYFFSSLTRTLTILQLERMLNYILDSVKIIKKSFYWTYEKSFRDFN
jgi:hypothetical protein